MVRSKDQCPTTPEELHEMTGGNSREISNSLQYAGLATRPDINFAISKLAEFLTNPGHVHLEATLSVLRYLNGTNTWLEKVLRI